MNVKSINYTLIILIISVLSLSVAYSQSSQIGPNEVGNEFWGFKFVPPQGWVYQVESDGIYLGHNTIAGLIYVMPHHTGNISEMKQEMQQGLQEEGTYLTPSGNISSMNENTLTADYKGYVDGTEAKAKGFGVLSPYGGGAYILAVSTPAMLSDDLINAAKTIVKRMKFIKTESTELTSHFVGKWTTYTKNTTTEIYLYPNGTYSDSYEAAYSGNLGGGGNWGNANQSGGNGRWSVKGNLESGKIMITTSSGEQYIYDYRVHVENGQTYYGEYWFNGTLYSKSGIE